jgi:hypothetical protein
MIQDVAIAGDTLLVISGTDELGGDHVLHGLDAASGTERWTFSPTNWWLELVAVDADEGVAYVSTADDVLGAGVRPDDLFRAAVGEDVDRLRALEIRERHVEHDLRFAPAGTLRTRREGRLGHRDVRRRRLVELVGRTRQYRSGTHREGDRDGDQQGDRDHLRDAPPSLTRIHSRHCTLRLSLRGSPPSRIVPMSSFTSCGKRLAPVSARAPTVSGPTAFPTGRSTRP